jgi:hypothetical protein
MKHNFYLPHIFPLNLTVFELFKQKRLSTYISNLYIHQSPRDSIVGIATGYGLGERGVRVRVPVGSRIFTSPIMQTGFGAHPTSYTMGTGGSFPGLKRPGREADHSPPANAEIKKMWIYTSTPPYIFMA